MAMSARAESQTVSVPFLDLRPSHEPLRDAVLTEIAQLVDSGTFTNGPQVRAFEEAFAGFCETVECVGLSSGLDALRLGLLSCGIEPGDEVILPANTFIATAEAVTQAGGVPVLVDVGESDLNLDPDAVTAAVTLRTRFLLPVHLYGQLADMKALTALATRHDLTIIEDACQAHGASRDGFTAGASGTAAAFSFYPGKNLGAFGDAGALVTDSREVADVTRAMREHGQRTKYHHDYVGWTARLDTIQALALLHKLPELPRWNDQRRAAANFYLERLADVGDLVLPPVPPDSEPVWHLFVVRTAEPEAIAAFLRERRISTGRHYPQPIHQTDAYRDLGYAEGDFPVAERIAQECLSLPIFPGISEEQLVAVVTGIEDYFRRG
jgi:dTDP-4-amino-4,6-dideoxygalactose transaminase